MLNRSFADNLFRNGLGTFGEVVELHGELTSALRSRTKFGSVTEHFGKRDKRVDNLGAVSVFRAEYSTAAGRYVAHKVAEVIFGGNYFYLHYRL